MRGIAFCIGGGDKRGQALFASGRDVSQRRPKLAFQRNAGAVAGE
jgi:hypothetical protein